MTIANESKYQGMLESTPAHERFLLLDGFRGDMLRTARECAALTKPLVVPPEGHTAGSTTVLPRQSHGGRLVSNFVSQLLLILFPPGIPFFKLDLKSVNIREMSKGIKLADGKSMHDTLRESFVALENNAATELLVNGDLEKLRMILTQLVVGGNSLFLTKGDTELVPLKDWVCSRSASGDLMELVFRRSYPISPDIQAQYQLTDNEGQEGYIQIYTRCFNVDGMWTIQEYVDKRVEPLSTIQVPDRDFWAHAVAWELFPGEDYGRGAVEESLGDLRTYESGTNIVNKSATALAKVIFTVKPNGLTTVNDVADAENTEIISGDPNDVGVIQANKVYDMSNFIGYLADIKRELDITFMMPSAIRRDGERVTAEEIRRMANEFEKSRGGTYNSLSRNLQTPMALKVLRPLVTTMGNLKMSDLLPVINTGLTGLGRSLELENLTMHIQAIMAIPGMINLYDLAQLDNRLSALRGLEVDSLRKTPEQLQAEQQQGALDNMATQVAPDMIKGAMNNG